MSQKDHWEQVYSTKRPEEVGWYASHLHLSLNWIKELNLQADSPIIDVGGGVSTLCDDLLKEGFESITVLDISKQALSGLKERVGVKGERIKWLDADITEFDLPKNSYLVWHDRAVFHFLTEPEQQQKYRDNLLKALKPGGHLIIGTFSLEAPSSCSGLPVQRYSKESLEDVLDGEFEFERQHKELHITPGGVEQMYLYCQFRKKT